MSNRRRPVLMKALGWIALAGALVVIVPFLCLLSLAGDVGGDGAGGEFTGSDPGDGPRGGGLR